MGDQGYGLYLLIVVCIVYEVKLVYDMGVEICMVIGGGNIFCGLQGSVQGMEWVIVDYMGMLVIIMNVLGMQVVLEVEGIYICVISVICMDEVVEFYICCCVMCYFEKKCVIIFVVGIGNFYFIIDIVVMLWVNEMGCEVIFKGIKVDGVYDKDFKKYVDVKCYDSVIYDEVL